MPDTVRNRVWTSCLVIIAIVATAVALVYTKTVMIPFILSLLIAFTISPFVTLLQVRAKMPRIIAITLVGLLLILCLGLLAFLITGTIKGTLANVDIYKERLVSLTSSVVDLAHKVGFELEDMDKQEWLQTLQQLPLFTYLKVGAGAAIKLLSNTFLITIFVVFLLSGESFKLPETSMWKEINKKIRIFLITKGVTSLITGVLTAFILYLFGLEMALMFGLLAFLLNFIPTIGSVFATLLPIPIALFQFTSVWPIAGVIVFPGLVQFLVGNVIEPKFMGENLDLHPVTILLSLMFWGLIWGIPGMILATPIAVVAKISLSQSSDGKLFSELMSGRVQRSKT